jgi:hypothetical protein
MKICSKCGVEYPEDRFPKGRRACWPCENARKRAWEGNNKQATREAKRAWRERNQEETRAAGRARYHADIEQSRARGRAKYHTDPLKKERNYARYHMNKTARLAYDKRRRAEAWEIVRAIEKASRKKHHARMMVHVRERQARKCAATPVWLSETHRGEIEALYVEAARLTKETGTAHHVDHIFPLMGDGFTGLHVPWNMRVISARANQSKGNKTPEGVEPAAWPHARLT